MPLTVARDEALTLNGGNAVAFTTDFGATAPAQPTDPAATPDVAFVPVGAIDQTGLTEGFSMTTTNIMAIGVLTPFRVLYTEQQKTFKLTMLEYERDIVQSVMFRVALSTLARASGLRTVQESATPVPDRRAWLFRIADGAVIQQIFAPQAEVTAYADVTYPQNDVAKAECTMTCYPDANGIVAYRLDNSPATP